MNIETVHIGMLAAICTTFALLPQMLKVIKTKKVEDISLIMYIIFTIGIILWLTYGLILHDPPIIFANSISLVFSGTILTLKIRITLQERKKNTKQSTN